MWKIIRYGKHENGTVKAEVITYVDGATADPTYQENPEDVAGAFGVDVPEGTPETVYLAQVSNAVHAFDGRPTTEGLSTAGYRPGWSRATASDMAAYQQRFVDAEEQTQREIRESIEAAKNRPAAEKLERLGLTKDDLKALLRDDQGHGNDDKDKD